MDLLPLLLLFGLLGAMMYFMSRRQRRAVAQQQQLQGSLSVGDRVMTTSGMYGTVTDTSDDTSIDIEIAPGVETTWLRAAVRERVGPDVEEYDEDLVDEVDDRDVLDEHERIDQLDDEAEVEEDASEEVKPGQQKN
jgi:preprotein translocase subunit YajC